MTTAENITDSKNTDEDADRWRECTALGAPAEEGPCFLNPLWLCRAKDKTGYPCQRDKEGE